MKGGERIGGTNSHLPRLTRVVFWNKATAQTELGPPMGELRDSEVAATTGAGDGFGFSVEGRPSARPALRGVSFGIRQRPRRSWALRLGEFRDSEVAATSAGRGMVLGFTCETHEKTRKKEKERERVFTGNVFEKARGKLTSISRDFLSPLFRLPF